MTRRADQDVDQQGDVLTRFRTRSGKSRTVIAVELGMESDTYRRYENGQTELRVNQIWPFARAYGVAARELIDALVPAEEPAAPWTLRGELEAAGLPPTLVAQIEADTFEWSMTNQREAAWGHILVWRARQAAGISQESASA